MTNNYCVARLKYDPTLHEYMHDTIERWDFTREQAESLAKVLNKYTTLLYQYKACRQLKTDSFLMSDDDVLWFNHIMEMVDKL